MHPDVTSRPTQVEEHLVQRGLCGGTEVVPYSVNPRGMVDQAGKFISRFEKVLEIHAVDTAVGMYFDPTHPLPGFQFGQLVNPAVD